jgi:YD repeat-containing protein
VFPSIAANTVVVNSEFTATLVSANLSGGSAADVEANVPWNVYGRYVNCRFLLDCSRSKAGTGFGTPACGAVLFASQWLANFHHCEFEIVARGGARAGWLYEQFVTGTAPGASYRVKRSVFRALGASVFQESATNTGMAVFYGGNADECGYFLISVKYNNATVAAVDYRANDADAVILTSPGFDGADADLALDDATTITVGGTTTTLEYDADGLPRSGRNALGRVRLAYSADAEASAVAMAVEIAYTPGERFTGTPEVVTYPRGSGLPIRATPATPTAVDGDKKEIRVGVPGLSGTYDAFNTDDENLTGDFGVGELLANPTAAQSAAWSLVGTLYDV